jgi:hypothetical protein
MPTTRSATSSLSWKCQRCNHANNSTKNKKRCSSCRGWRDKITPLSACARCNVLNKAGVDVSGNAPGSVDIFEGFRENDSPNTNNASCCKAGMTSSQERSGEKRKSHSQGNNGVARRPPLSPILPPALQPTHQTITPNLPSLQCSGVYGGYFGPAFTIAAKSLKYTADQLKQWAREPDLGVKSFAGSILSMSRSICLPYQGVILDRAHNPCNGFVFRAISCTRNCREKKESIAPIVLRR